MRSYWNEVQRVALHRSYNSICSPTALGPPILHSGEYGRKFVNRPTLPPLRKVETLSTFLPFEFMEPPLSQTTTAYLTVSVISSVCAQRLDDRLSSRKPVCERYRREVRWNTVLRRTTARGLNAIIPIRRCLHRFKLKVPLSNRVLCGLFDTHRSSTPGWA